MLVTRWGLHKAIWVPEMPSSRDLSKPAAGNDTHTCLSQEHQAVVLIQLHVVSLYVCAVRCVFTVLYMCVLCSEVCIYGVCVCV